MSRFDLVAAARQEMLDQGFEPDFPAGTDRQIANFRAKPAAVPGGDVLDLRNLFWSSIDNDTSRDLDQIEVAEAANPAGTRIRVAVADVDYGIELGTPIDRHATSQTTTVYTGVKNFSMLPEEFSTDLTSLNPNQDRLSMVVEYVVSADGVISSPSIYLRPGPKSRAIDVQRRGGMARRHGTGAPGRSGVRRITGAAEAARSDRPDPVREPSQTRRIGF